MKIFALLAIVLLANFAQAKPYEPHLPDSVVINPYDVKVEQLNTGAWSGIERKILVNGGMLLKLESQNDVTAINKVLLPARATNTMIVLNFEALKALGAEGAVRDGNRHEHNVAKLFSMTTQPIPPSSVDASRVQLLEERVRALEELQKR